MRFIEVGTIGEELESSCGLEMVFAYCKNRSGQQGKERNDINYDITHHKLDSMVSVAAH